MKDANGVKPRGQRVSRAEEPAASRKVARGTPERGVAGGGAAGEGAERRGLSSPRAAEAGPRVPDVGGARPDAEEEPGPGLRQLKKQRKYVFKKKPVFKSVTVKLQNKPGEHQTKRR